MTHFHPSLPGGEIENKRNENLELFLSAFVTLFVIVDPFGGAAVFASLTQNLAKESQFKIALKAVIIASVLLSVFCVIGHTLLAHMGVSLSALLVAGGALLFVTAFRMIMGYHDPDQLSSDSSAYKDRSDIAVFPMAIPLLAGPGTMTAALMLTASAANLFDYSQVFIAIILVQTITFLSLIGAGWLGRFFGPTGNGIIARVMGILLAAMAIQFIADGAKELWVG